jgi:manganese oxidase
VKTFIGLKQRALSQALDRAAPTAMAMGTSGMADMAEMSMPLPANTLPMMTGQGPFGGIEMGGMFTVVKVREGLAAGDYRDPGWYKHPPGTVAYEVDAGTAGKPARQKTAPGKGEAPGKQMPGMDMPGTTPGGHHDHH